MGYNRLEIFRQTIIKKANKLIARYNYLIKLLAAIVTMFVCIKFTIYLMRDFINVGDDSSSLIGGIIFGVILSGVIANLWEAITNLKDLKAVVLERYPGKPKDGEIYKISGILKPVGPPLISPFTRTSCVAYKYKITHPLENSDTPTTALDANGAAMTPSVIQGEKYKTKAGMLNLRDFSILLSPQNRVSKYLIMPINISRKQDSKGCL